MNQKEQIILQKLDQVNIYRKSNSVNCKFQINPIIILY
ncbi:hypothetical protein pb186bvf_003824 [Paramecium bursaria]